MANNCSTTISSKTPFTKEEFINLMDGVAKNSFVYYAYLRKNGSIWFKTHGWHFYGDEDLEKGKSNDHYLSVFVNNHKDKVRIRSIDEGGIEADEIYSWDSDESEKVTKKSTLPCITENYAGTCYVYDEEGGMIPYYLDDEVCEECDYTKKHSEYFSHLEEGKKVVVEAIITWHDPKYTLFLEEQSDGSTINLGDNKPIICPICGANYDDILRDKGAYTLFFHCGHKVIRVHKDDNGVILSEEYREGTAFDELKKHIDEEFGGNYIVE